MVVSLELSDPFELGSCAKIMVEGTRRARKKIFLKEAILVLLVPRVLQLMKLLDVMDYWAYIRFTHKEYANQYNGSDRVVEDL